MTITALALNCTLKPSPETSNTQALIDKVFGFMQDLGAQTDTVRVVDHAVKFGVSSDEGDGDEWPAILTRVKQADILVIGTPIWFGVRSSVAQLVMERLDGTYNEGDPQTGQYPLYGKVGGVVVTGNEDGAHDAASNTLFNLSHMGCTIPPNADCYWVGDAGPGPSYIEARGDKHIYTAKTARWMAHNLMHFASVLAENPIPTNLKQLSEDAQNECGEPDCPPSHGASN